MRQMARETSRIIYLVIIVILASALAVTLFLLLHRQNQTAGAQDKLDALRDYVADVTEEYDGETTADIAVSRDVLADLGIVIPTKVIDWEALRKENPDIYAWLYVPGTQIDYPVLQREGDNNYYVEHNIDGSSGYPGCLTTQYEYNGRDFTDYNTCIYGHNMRNGSMFHGLHSYADASFLEANRYAYVFTPEKTLVYEIFAAYKFSNALIPYEYDFTTKAGRKEYLSEVLSIRGMGNQFRKDVDVTAKNHLLTLSTCTSPSDDNYRWLVQAVLVNDEALSYEEIVHTLGRTTE